MANMLDYLQWRGDLSFSVSPFNLVDNLILSEFSYLLLECGGRDRMTIAEVSEAIKDRPDAFGFLEQGNNRRMLTLMGEGDRFAGTVVCYYRSIIREEYEKQFAAMTFLLTDGTAYIGYRGTDHTLVGWKEDMNMSFTSPVPAQSEALDYLNEIGRLVARPLRVGGHSKGGNLAVYAAAYAESEIQDAILNVYSNDGPGMDEATITSDGYARILPKLVSILPEFSIVGMLMQHQGDYSVVRSSAPGLMQHVPFSWQVERDRFETLDELHPASLHLGQAVNVWLAGLTIEERETMVNALFAVLATTGVNTVDNLGEAMIKNAGAVLSALRRMDPATRRRVRQLIGGVLDISAYKQIKHVSSPEKAPAP